MDARTPTPGGPMERLLRFCLENKLVVGLLALMLAGWGVLVAPFDWDLPGVPRDPVPVDAIPDTGENQQIVFTTWPGRSPQDVEDQVTYPLSVALLGVPGVKSLRSSSMFGFSSVFVIFDEDVEFYWSRSRLLEKLASLPAGTLPPEVQPTLGPDATALGQVFWYTLEGHDEEGQPVGGFDLQELRSVQDWYVRYALASVEGVSEVASIGGYVREYQIDVDPDAMRSHGVTLEDVFHAVRSSNVDVGARTIEVNRAEYVVRGLGLIESLEDIEDTVVKVVDNVPITVRSIADVGFGPALRRGALDKGGAEAVGGVVVVRYGANPLAVIERVKARIAEISGGLPRRTLDDGTVSRVTVVPFYDRTGLIRETLGTLGDALHQEILITLLVVLLMVGHVRSALLISGLLPLATLMTFIAMKVLGVDANVVALSGIAIAIGTMVDVGIVVTENTLKHVTPEDTVRERFERVLRGASEVSGAVTTAILTTVISFLPVLTMEGAEGKLFKPLAYTKTFALIASIVVALVLLPPMAHLLLGRGGPPRVLFRRVLTFVLLVGGAAAGWWTGPWIGALLVAVGLWRLTEERLPEVWRRTAPRLLNVALVIWVGVVLARAWAPLGPTRPVSNLLFVALVLGGLLLAFSLVVRFYVPLLRLCLRFKVAFLCMPLALTLVGLAVWLGVPRLSAPLARGVAAVSGLTPEEVRAFAPWAAAERAFPGLGKEFMPRLDEGSFLLMPVTMAHASIGEAFELLQQQDMRIRAVPEIEDVVGKIGRVESALDPAPVSMVETVITYKSEFVVDEDARPIRFAYDEAEDRFLLDEDHELIPDEDGRPFRQWRPSIRGPEDIWKEIEEAAAVPGMTTASMLQPIETRRIMLQTGMRAPMGIKVYGPDLESIERTALDLEHQLKQVPSVRAETVLADRVIGKPYLEIDIDRKAIARYGLTVRQVQDVIEVAIGGKPLTTTVEGRERYPVRVRYQRELRDQVEDLERILVTARGGAPIPLGQLADVRYTPGPQNIKSEDTFLVAYVLFDKQFDRAEVDVVEECRAFLDERIERGELVLPTGVSFRFAGNYENQVRAAERIRIVLPVALFLIFLILYLQFRSAWITATVFAAVFVAWSGGFLLLWLYGQEGFLDFELFGRNARDLFQVGPVNLSVAVWVGFLALFGIATDDGVLMATYLKQTFERETPRDRLAVRDAVVQAGLRRIRPCMMTTATTVLALLPVLTSRGRGSDVMVPMAIPAFGGMLVAVVTIFVVPTLYCAAKEWRLPRA